MIEEPFEPFEPFESGDEIVAVDLRALDPTMPAAAFERRVARIRHAAQGVLWRRRNAGSPLSLLTGWRAPLVAAGLAVMIASAALLGVLRTEGVTETDAVDEIAGVFGVSSPIGGALTGTMSTSDALLGVEQ